MDVTAGSPRGCRLTLLFNPVLREVVRERTLADAHQLGGVLLDTSSVLQSAANRLALDALDVLPQLERWQTGGLRRRRTEHRDRPGGEHRPGRQHHGPLDGVLE